MTEDAVAIDITPENGGYPLHEKTVKAAVRRAVRRAHIPKHATPPGLLGHPTCPRGPGGDRFGGGFGAAGGSWGPEEVMSVTERERTHNVRIFVWTDGRVKIAMPSRRSARWRPEDRTRSARNEKSLYSRAETG